MGDDLPEPEHVLLVVRTVLTLRSSDITSEKIKWMLRRRRRALRGGVARGPFPGRPAAFVRTNGDGSQTLLEACRASGVSRVVHVSTDEVCGSIEEGRETDLEVEIPALREGIPLVTSGQTSPRH
jgi:hypothetical protein